MKTLNRYSRPRRAFTLVELLTVIAIIAVLAAIIFPVFGAVREQARQSNTMSNMHSVYLGARLFNEDEGIYPSVLFGYAEVPIQSSSAPCSQYPSRPAMPGDEPNVTPMDQATGAFSLSGDCENVNKGYLYRDQVKAYNTFLCTDNTVTDKRAVTIAYYPRNVWKYVDPQNPTTLDDNKIVRWRKYDSSVPDVTGDQDLPTDVNGNSYVGQPKLYYIMDSMDIGPMLDDNGKQVQVNGVPIYELHYTPDWTHYRGALKDVDPATNQPIITQLKYKNPPADRTIITSVTAHTATAGSNNVIVMLLNGSARKMNYYKALDLLPLNYAP